MLSIRAALLRLLNENRHNHIPTSAMSPQIAKIIACIRQAAPYLAIELIVPGGSLVALVLWLLRNRASFRRFGPVSPSRP